MAPRAVTPSAACPRRSSRASSTLAGTRSTTASRHTPAPPLLCDALYRVRLAALSTRLGAWAKHPEHVLHCQVALLLPCQVAWRFTICSARVTPRGARAARAARQGLRAAVLHARPPLRRRLGGECACHMDRHLRARPPPPPPAQATGGRPASAASLTGGSRACACPPSLPY